MTDRVSISVLIPTRGRPDELRQAIATMHDLAFRPQQIEYLLRTDVDQPRAWATWPRPFDRSRDLKLTETRGPRGAGYREVYRMYNELAEGSNGDWLINWNDDVEMLTPGWDDLLRQAPSHSIQFLRRDILEKADTTFPATGRSVYLAMGHLSLQTHADDWMRVVAERAGVAVWRNDVVFHHHRLNDETSWDRDHGGYDVGGFNAPETQALLEKDAERVRAAKPKGDR